MSANQGDWLMAHVSSVMAGTCKRSEQSGGIVDCGGAGEGESRRWSRQRRTGGEGSTCRQAGQNHHSPIALSRRSARDRQWAQAP